MVEGGRWQGKDKGMMFNDWEVNRLFIINRP